MSVPTFKNYIAGEWVGASDGKTIENINPATGEVIGYFASATAEDTRRAIAAAKEALPKWAALPGPSRAAILDKAGQIIAARTDELAETLTREEGKTLAEAKAEVTRARDIFKYYAGEGFRAGGDVIPANTPETLLFTKREALGVVAVITPWNFPIAIPAWKIAPALAYGNTVVFKPASLVPHTALKLVEILIEAGVPPGVINLVVGSGSAVGNTLAESKDIAGLSFTGSYSVGMKIYEKTARNLVRTQLEMGGKNPTIVLNDANIPLAVDIAVRGGFGLTGQACTATSRVIVEEGVADAFTQALVEAARNLKVGNGLESGVQMGPAVSADQLQTDLEYVSIGQREGAKLLVGGEPIRSGAGFFVQPTVFEDVEPSMRIAQEEIFGPVIGVIRAKDFDDAIVKANDIGFGLSASIVTNDLNKALRFADRIEAGVVKVNEPTTGVALQAPFGGFKGSSANTFKEQGQAAVEFYTRTKTVYVKYG
ncbi:MAG: aldehyde dehydrogenase family protein [Thermoflexales bacterium]|nr:aldehyde dehydrogenase family protein [Thermoflexales bacterium]MDW8351942.1 aldehyde dehydrogenase family protein [Anaerolineae bacterium]